MATPLDLLHEDIAVLLPKDSQFSLQMKLYKFISVVEMERILSQNDMSHFLPARNPAHLLEVDQDPRNVK